MGKGKVTGRFEGIAKLDLAASDGAAVAGSLTHGDNRWGGEAVFVSAAGPSGGELVV
jgi:hypothetical protein